MNKTRTCDKATQCKYCGIPVWSLPQQMLQRQFIVFSCNTGQVSDIMMCTVVCLQVVSECQKIVHTRNNSRLRPASPNWVNCEGGICWACHPPPSVKVNLKELELDPFWVFFSTILLLKFYPHRLFCPIKDVCVVIGYCLLIIMLKTAMGEGIKEGEKVMACPFQTKMGIWQTSVLKAAKGLRRRKSVQGRVHTQTSPVTSWLWNGSLRLKLRFEISATITSNVIWGGTSIMRNR